MKHTVELTTQRAVEDAMSPDNDTPCIIDFWAPWCGPCKVMKPAFEAMAEEFNEDDVTFYTLNTEAHPQLAAAFRIRSIPTLMYIHKGDILDVQKGVTQPNHLRKRVEWLLSKANGEGFLTRLFGKSTVRRRKKTS